MKHSLLFAVSLAALSLTACGKKTEPSGDASPTISASDDMGMAPASSMAISPGQTFANTSAASDAFEIETSKLASSKAQSAKVKAFAVQMIKAHTDSTAKLKTAAGLTTPSIMPDAQLSAAQQQALTDLSAKSGADFDRAYAQAQTAGHQATLDALKSYAAVGDVPSLKAFAGELVPIVTAHLNMAKSL